MPHFPQPFWRNQTKSWYVTFGVKQHNLGNDWEKALHQYALLLAGETGEIPQTLPPASLTVEAAVSQFLDSCRARLKPRTIQWYRERLGWMATALGAHRPLCSLTPGEVMGWALDDDKQWSATYRHGLLTAAGRLTAWAKKKGLVKEDALCGQLEKPPVESAGTLLTYADYGRLVGLYPAGDCFRDLLSLVWETGCRPQEALRVECAHYQAKARRLSLPAKKAKGGLRARHIYLSEVAEEMVTRVRNEVGVGILMRNEDGVPWTRHAVACRFERAAERVGAKYRLYDLRHSFAHRMLTAGLPAATVAHLMGHVDTQMVLRVYGHLEAADEFLRAELKRGNARGESKGPNAG